MRNLLLRARWASLALALVCGMAPAAAPTPTIATYDLANEAVAPIYGATDAASCLSNWTTLQGLVDRIGPKGGGRIKVGDGKLCIARSITIPYSNVSIEGEGALFTTLATPGRSCPAIVAGLPIAYKGASLTPADFVDAAPLSDGTLTGIGLKLRRNLHLDIPFQSWTHPGAPGKRGPAWDRWQGMTSGYLSLFIDAGPTGLQGSGPVFSCSRSNQLTPMSLFVTGGVAYWDFLTADGVSHRLSFPIAGWTGPSRIHLQWDLTAGTFSCVTGKQFIPLKPPTNFIPGSAFMPNIANPWKFGGCGSHDGTQSDYYSITNDFAFTLLGAKLGTGNPYSATALPGTDAQAFRSPNASTIAYLPLNDDPAYVIASRQIATTNGQGSGSVSVGCGWLMDPNAANPFASTGGLGLADISIQGQGVYGYGVALGTEMYATVRDVAVNHCGVCIGNISGTTNYTHQFTGRSVLGGAIFGLHSVMGTIQQRGILQFTNNGLAAIYTEAAELDADHLFFAYGDSGPSALWTARIGGNLKCNLFRLDNEGETGNMEAIIRHDLQPNIYYQALEIGRVDLSMVPPGGSIIALDSVARPNDPARAVVRCPNIRAATARPFKSIFDRRDARWSGDFSSPWQPPAPTPIVSGIAPTGP